MKRSLTTTALVGVLVVVILTISVGALGAPPLNDNVANSTLITLTTTPFSDTSDLTEATIEPGEPGGDPGGVRRSVWYSFTPPADAVVSIARPLVPPSPGSPTLCELRTSNWMAVYRADGAGFAGLTGIENGSATVRVKAGTTYYVQGGDIQYGTGGGCPNTFALNVSVVSPPSNDNFANAIPFTSAPFSDSKDLTGATVEPGEPLGCGGGVTGSAWYAFTPTVSGGYGSADPGVNAVNVYTGTSLSNLKVVDCSDWFGAFFWADAGTTYYLQYYGGGMRINDVPPPAADFRYTPSTPSILDDVMFSYDNGGYWDPTVNGWSWDFGDGTTASGQNVSHRYATNGDYSVTLTVAARGGRTNGRTYVVRVRPPDTTSPAIVVVDRAGGHDFDYNATSPAGALVEYTATVTDDIDPNPDLTCTPPSASVVPIGATSVNCVATDEAGNTGTASFTITVKGAAEQLATLRADVQRVGAGTSLADTVKAAQTALATKHARVTCAILHAFSIQVNAQSRRKIPAGTAATLLADAARIRAVLGC